MNEMYKELTIIKLKKLEFKKVLNKITFSLSKGHFSLLEKKDPSEKVDFFYQFRSHERPELPAHVNDNFIREGYL